MPLLVSGALFAPSSSDGGVAPPRLDIGYRVVPSSVDHAPVRADGTRGPTRSLPPFSQTRVGAGWTWGEAIDLDVAVTRSNMTFSRDAYAVEGLDLTLDRRFGLDPSGASWRLRLGLSGHRASEARKTSRTRLGEIELTDVAAKGASDVTIGVGISRDFGSPDAVSWTLGARLSGTLVDSGTLSGIATDERGCRFRFDATRRGGRVDLVEPCGAIESFDQRYPNQQSIDDRFGFSPVRDMSYNQRSAALHLTARRTLGKALATAGIDAAWHARGRFDRRTRSLGERPVGSGVTAFVGVDVPLGRRWSVRIGAALHRAPFLAEMPLGYSNLTAHRYDRAANSLSIGLEYRSGAGRNRS